MKDAEFQTGRKRAQNTQCHRCHAGTETSEKPFIGHLIGYYRMIMTPDFSKYTKAWRGKNQHKISQFALNHIIYSHHIHNTYRTTFYTSFLICPISFQVEKYDATTDMEKEN